jgi:hypothetical protein
MRPARYLTWLFGLLGVLWLVMAAVVPAPDVRVQVIRALLGLGLLLVALANAAVTRSRPGR